MKWQVVMDFYGMFSHCACVREKILFTCTGFFPSIGNGSHVHGA